MSQTPTGVEAALSLCAASVPGRSSLQQCIALAPGQHAQQLKQPCPWGAQQGGRAGEGQGKPRLSSENGGGPARPRLSADGGGPPQLGRLTLLELLDDQAANAKEAAPVGRRVRRSRFSFSIERRIRASFSVEGGAFRPSISREGGPRHAHAPAQGPPAAHAPGGVPPCAAVAAFYGTAPAQQPWGGLPNGH